MATLNFIYQYVSHCPRLVRSFSYIGTGLPVPRGCLQFVIVVFPDHTHLLFPIAGSNSPELNICSCTGHSHPRIGEKNFGARTRFLCHLQGWECSGSVPIMLVMSSNEKKQKVTDL